MAPLPKFPFAGEIRAVLFDAGNTLLWLDHARMAEIVAPTLGNVSHATMRDAEMRARPRLDPFLRTASRREGRDTALRYARAVVAELRGVAELPGGAQSDDSPTATRAATDLVAAWGTLWTCPPADAAPTLDALAARGFAVGCLSNSSGNVRSLLETAGLAHRLGCIVDSGLEGVEKPDPRIFRLAAARIGAAPGECMYVGDFVSLDVDGARGAGMHAALVDPIGAWGDDATEAPRVRSLAEIVARL